MKFSRAGIAAGVFVVLCGACGSGGGRNVRASDTATGAAHEHHAPHGGTLVELGEEAAHLELVLDSAAGSLTAYPLDGEAEQSVRVRAARIDVQLSVAGERLRPLALMAVASPLTGDTEQESAEYRASLELLKGAASVSGTIDSVAVRGVGYHDVVFTCHARPPG